MGIIFIRRRLKSPICCTKFFCPIHFWFLCLFVYLPPLRGQPTVLCPIPTQVQMTSQGAGEPNRGPFSLGSGSPPTEPSQVRWITAECHLFTLQIPIVYHRSCLPVSFYIKTAVNVNHQIAEITFPALEMKLYFLLHFFTDLSQFLSTIMQYDVVRQR
jgi:hypothetical protein